MALRASEGAVLPESVTLTLGSGFAVQATGLASVAREGGDVKPASKRQVTATEKEGKSSVEEHVTED